MATICLRTLLDGRQENAFSTDGIGDVCVMLKGIHSRLHAVRLGIVAHEALALALRRVGTDINPDFVRSHHAGSDYLHTMINLARRYSIISKEEERELRIFNKEANRARHDFSPAAVMFFDRNAPSGGVGFAPDMCIRTLIGNDDLVRNVFPEGGVADMAIGMLDADKRLSAMMRALVAHTALHDRLSDMGSTRDLSHLVDAIAAAFDLGAIKEIERKYLLYFNHQANKAKHRVSEQF